MRKALLAVIVTLVTMSLAAGTAFAEGFPSAKATAAVDELVSLAVVASANGPVAGPWTTILTQEIKTANKKDLFIDVSLECGMFSLTQVKSKDANTDTSAAASRVRVRVRIDGTAFALPDNGLFTPSLEGAGVSFCTRVQILSAKLQGILECPAGAAIPSECVTTFEEIALLILTLNANSFNFIAADLGPGVHTVEVQARAEAASGKGNGLAVAAAFAGAGSVTIEEVRMIKDEQVLF